VDRSQLPIKIVVALRGNQQGILENVIDFFFIGHSSEELH